MSDDLFETVVSETATDRPAFRQAPPGDYLVRVREAKRIKSAAKGTPGIELKFSMLEFVGKGDPDMEGVDLARCRLNDTLWVTENTTQFVAEKLGRISAETVGTTFTEALELLPGSEVVVRLKHITTNKDGEPLNTPRLEVVSYYTADWYMTNKAAA